MKRIHPLIPAVFALLVVVVPVGAAAQIAMMNFSSSAVTWSPMIANDGMTLTVSGGGVWFQKSFKSGASPRFDTFDAEGNALADGVYKWELSARPARAAGDRGEFENSRTNADGSFVRRSTAPRIEPQSGTFRIANGSIVDPNGASEAGGATGGGIGGIGGGGGKGVSGTGGPGTNDQVILDDLIVDGSICAGFDCTNGESFGFDTLRLKENNLRIRAVDTSNSASFPTNDWQIVFNETTNGGANKFSVEDIDGARTPFTIEAGAPSHSLYVEDGGRLGLGTSTPVSDIHVKSGNTPTLRLEQDGSSGFSAQTWDVAGNEAGFFIRDATNGSTLPFRIRPGAQSSMIDISATDRVGINEQSPDDLLHLTGGNLRIEQTSATGVNMRLVNDARFWLILNDGSGNLNFRDGTASTNPFQIEPGAPNNLLTLSAFNGVEVSGVQVHPPDYVFEPDYELPSIEEQAEYMFSNKHLPAVGPGRYDEDGSAKISLINHQFGVLEELEKAHIYISQLNDAVQQKDAELEELKERLARIEESLRDQ